ncbi:spliceosomal snRNP component [Coemansia sp. RSA 2607]|nr:spliceosomal snRNP component [Coemansia sp. RSA 2607]
MSNDDTFYGQRSAFPVSNSIELGDLDQQPESGEQYLLRVMMEADATPRFAVATNITRPLSNSAAPPAGSKDEQSENVLIDAVLPSSVWLQQFAQYFRDQRSRLVQIISNTALPDGFALPDRGNQREWKSFCYENSIDPLNSKNILYALFAMDQAMAIRLIGWMTSWLAIDKLQRAESMWLWYLMLKIDELLDHDDTHTLRQLCRKLRDIRENISQIIGNNSADIIQHRGSEIAAVNILIASVTRGYGQRDLE